MHWSHRIQVILTEEGQDLVVLPATATALLPLAFALPAMELLDSHNHAPKLVIASQENLPRSLMQD